MSIPNLVFFVRHPVEFLVRGGYSVVGDMHGKLLNILATAGLPLYYPYRYRFVWGEAHVLDGVSASMTGSGVDPVPVAVGLLAALGLVVTLRRDRDLTALFLVATHALTIVFLGPLGPSLTRVLILVPVLVFYASVGTLELARTPRARAVAGAVLAFVAAASLGAYFRRLSDPRRPAREYVGDVQTAMGERARALAASGPVVAVVSDNGNVVRALAFGTRDHGRGVPPPSVRLPGGPAAVPGPDAPRRDVPRLRPLAPAGILRDDRRRIRAGAS